MYPKKKSKANRYLRPNLSTLLMLGVGLVGGYQVHDHMGAPPSVNVAESNTQVRFSPKGGCTNLLTQAMHKAQHSIEVAIFDLTSTEIADTLISLHKRGIRIRIVADNRQSKGKHSNLPRLHQHGIPIRIAKCSGLMHHKVSIIDDGKGGMFTGSFNYTFGAENKNTENLLYIKSKALAKLYQAEWQKLWDRGKLYTP